MRKKDNLADSKKSGGGGWPTPPDYGRKVKKRKKSFSVQQSGIAKSGLQKKMLKKVKKSRKTNYGNHPVRCISSRDFHYLSYCENYCLLIARGLLTESSKIICPESCFFFDHQPVPL
jgi:hypothetical protein